MVTKGVRSGIRAAISRVMADRGEFATNWIFLGESIDENGKRGFWVVVPKDAMPWDSLGLLLYAIQIEQVQTIVDENKENS